MSQEKEIECAQAAQSEGIGTVKIANDVVAMIAGLAAAEVEGVSAAPSASATNEFMEKVGMKKQTRGVKVDIFEGIVSVDIALTLEYGYNIPTTCAKVQEKIKAAIETMTGFEVSDVNIKIVGVKINPNG